MKYIVRDRQCGWVIEECETYEEAIDVIKEFEKEDKANNEYTPDYYEIVNI